MESELSFTWGVGAPTGDRDTQRHFAVSRETRPSDRSVFPRPNNWRFT